MTLVAQGLKHQNLTLKHLKFAPKCFDLLSNHLQGVLGRTSLRYCIVMLIYICYEECRYVAVCQFIPSLSLSLSLSLVCVCVCVCVCVHPSGRDYFMECAYFPRDLQHIPWYSLDQIGTHTHTRARARTHAHTHAHTRTHARTRTRARARARNELTYSHIPTHFITNVNQHSNSVSSKVRP